MTKKHFQMIAEVLRQDIADGGAITIAYAFADRLAAEFPLFNRDRFLDACGRGTIWQAL